MFQVVGKIVSSKQVIGFMLYDYQSKKMLKAPLKDCVNEIKSINNLEINNGKLTVTDGAFSKLPEYDVNGSPNYANLPVVLERVISNGTTVGYTLIDKGVYKKCKVPDLFLQYYAFFNVRIVKKGNTTFLSAKRGNLMTLNLDELSNRTNNTAEDDYVCNCKDFKIEEETLRGYYGDDRKVKIPYGVTHIGYGAFHCRSVTSVVIPDSVIHIGSDAFAHCVNLESVVIPEGVTSIGDYAFTDCTSLKSIKIPASVTVISRSAFEECKNLESIEVASGNANYKSENGVLFSQNKMELIKYPCGKSGDYKVPDSVAKIGGYAFSGCSKLTSVEIPNSIKIINDDAFYYCTELKKVQFYKGHKHTGDFNNNGHIGYEVFMGCKKLTSIDFPSDMEYRIMGIEANAFYGCTNLTDLHLPKSVEVIGRQMDCSSFTRVDLGDTSIKGLLDYSFCNCHNLVYVRLPKTLKQIDYAFANCKNLGEVFIPASVTKIDAEAFSDCPKLIIKCVKGSYAEQFAKQHNYKFINI